MKRFFFLAVAATCLLASCNKTEVVYNDGPQEIAMMAVTKTATKAPIAGASLDVADYQMAVAAYMAQGDAGNGTFTSGNYFPKTIFSGNRSNSLWTGSRYWPLTASTINFLAVTQFKSNYPDADMFDQTTVFDATTPASGATVTLPDNSEYQLDLLYAAGQGKCAPNNYPNVDMVFRHALSWIFFTVKTNDAGVNRITVNSITLNDAIYNGTLTLNNLEYDTTETYQSSEAAIEASWAVAESDRKDLNVTSNPVNCISTAQNFGDEGLLVVPGTQTSFTIDYTITHETGVTNTLQYTYVLDNRFNWEMGKKYIYNITLNLNEIKIDAEVENWEDVVNGPTLG